MTSLFLFSGCADKEPIAIYEGCPKLEIYDLPPKIMVKGTYLGKTNVYTSYPEHQLLGDTDVIAPSEDTNTSMINGVLMPVEMIIDIIDYTTKLRTGAEKFNAQILDKNATK